jgi:hypothetical protein
MNEKEALDLAGDKLISVTTDFTDRKTKTIRFNVGGYVVSKPIGARVWTVSQNNMIFCDGVTGKQLKFTRGNAMEFAINRAYNDRSLGL